MRSMLRTLVIFATLAIGCAAHADVPALTKQTLLDGKVTVLIPEGFNPLTPELLAQKYPNGRRPNLVFSDKDVVINVAVDLVDAGRPVTLPDLPDILEAMKSGMKSQFPTATWYRSEMTNINGRPFLLMELRSPTASNDVRNIMAGTALDNRLLLLSFNVVTRLENEWMPSGNKIIQSIVVK